MYTFSCPLPSAINKRKPPFVHTVSEFRYLQAAVCYPATFPSSQTAVLLDKEIVTFVWEIKSRGFKVYSRVKFGPAIPGMEPGGRKVRLKRINRSISPPTNNILSMLTSKKLFSLEFLNSRISFRRGTNFQVPSSLSRIFYFSHADSWKRF